MINDRNLHVYVPTSILILILYCGSTLSTALIIKRAPVSELDGYDKKHLRSFPSQCCLTLN